MAMTLQMAQNLIVAAASRLEQEELELSHCLGRFAARPLEALVPLPGYDQSLRDGFAICKDPLRRDGAPPQRVFGVVDEVAAGDTRRLSLEPGEAMGIMTGALLPRGAVAVVPKEQCRLVGRSLEVEGAFFSQGRHFIHGQGSDLSSGEVIVAKGEAIGPQRQILLSAVGHGRVPVIRKPRVSFFCTGSELLTGPRSPLPGQKFSANGALLSALIRRAGAQLQEQGAAKDEPQAVSRLLGQLGRGLPDIIISTGGMGPGKFDLVEEAFAAVGGEVLYRSLDLRPGKSTLFGTLGTALFFGMPGPPPAVQLLFQELISPAIRAMQGASICCPPRIKAILSEDLHQAPRDLPRLKAACLSLGDGHCRVRPVRRLEEPNCYIYCPVDLGDVRAGEQVIVHLSEQGAGLAGISGR